MINAVVDTNVLADVAMAREPFYQVSKPVFSFAHMGLCTLWMVPHQLADLHYLLSEGGKRSRSLEAQRLIRALCEQVHVYALNEDDVMRALDAGWKDFEDCLVAQAAYSLKANVIITRDKKNYQNSPTPIMSPEEFVPWLRLNHRARRARLTWSYDKNGEMVVDVHDET